MENLMKSKFVKDLLSICVLVMCIVPFFVRLFYPEVRIFATPEYSKSDITHFNVPVKKLMFDSLRGSGGLLDPPLWADTFGIGFPMYAESQMGYWFIPNQILLRLPDFAVTFNLLYLVAFVTAGIGMYVACRVYGTTRWSAVVGGLILALSGFFAAHVQHLNMLQAASILPWIIAVEKICRNNPKVWKYIVLSLLVAQQLAAGYAQISFITLLSLAIVCLWQFWQSKWSMGMLRHGLYVVVALILAVGLMAVQLLPTYELQQASVRSEAFTLKEATTYSLPWKNLATLVDPFAVGSPKNGSYAMADSGDIFWEANIYVGLMAVILLMLFPVAVWQRKNDQRQAVTLGLAVLVPFLAMLGKYSPTYFLLGIWPLSLFRVPARFSLVLIVVIALAAAVSLDGIIKRYVRKSWAIIIHLLVIVAIVGPYYCFWSSYHLTVSAPAYLSPPKVAQELAGPLHRTMSDAYAAKNWYDKYMSDGWAEDLDFYTQNRSLLQANINTLWDVQSFDIYTGLLTTKRLNTAYEMVRRDMLNQNQASLSKLYQLFSITDIMNNADDHVATGVIGRQAYLVHEYEKVGTVEEVYRVATQPEFQANVSAIVEHQPDFQAKSRSNTDQVGEVKADLGQVKSHGNGRYTFDADAPGILIVTQMYYPGWQAWVDDEQVPIFPVNLVYQGVEVAKGSHEVHFIYAPETYNRGLIISSISLFTMCSVVFLSLFWRRRRVSATS